MGNPILINKENRNKYVGKKGIYQVMKGDEPVLKRNGKPWTGKTLNMGKYYGVIIGSGKYKNVRLSQTWNDNYTILFTESN